jgi:polysaccharide export outer membrane protein
MRKPTIIAVAASLVLASATAGLQASAQMTPAPSASPSATPAATSAPMAARDRAPVGERTVIHPGDQLNVQVFGDQTLTQNTMVLADGTVDYPLIGRVPVAGKTPEQAAATLANRMHEYVRHPVVTVAITQLGQPDVLVLGDVKNPGKYQLRSDAKLTDAIASAGGLAITNGAFPDARIADAAGNVTTVSLEKLLQGGDSSLDRPLSEGSVVYVPGPVAFTVDVTGAVDHPGDIQVNEGDHLSVAIAKAGNSQNSHADLNHVRVIRTAPDGKQTTEEINLYDALKNGNQSVDLALEKGDVIFVPEGYQHHTDFFSGVLYVLSRLIP